jgi:hypothetical protein
MSEDKEKKRQKAKEALMYILNMEKGLPEDFDYRKELQEARLEKYDNFSGYECILDVLLKGELYNNL